MGLRIQSNIPSVTALRSLNQADQNQRRSLERLSTGLRINQAADDPSGLVISEQLRSQITSMTQAISNSQNASNLISTSEAALNEVSNLLVQVKESVVFALNSGGNDADQIAAEQDAIDQALSSIDRIAQTTKFGTRKLLDGSSSLSVASNAAGISALNIQNVTFDGQTDQQFTLEVTTVASLAGGSGLTGDVYGGTSTDDVTFRLTGDLGTQDITITSAMDTTAFDDAINAFTLDTGAFASGGLIYSTEYGEDQTLTLEVLSGTLNLAAGGTLDSSDGIQTDSGVDTVGHVDGVTFSADGLDLRVVSDVITGDFRLSDGTDGGPAPATGSFTFTIDNSGLVFQLNQGAGAHDREQVGIRSVHSSLLGHDARTVAGIAGSTLTIGGFLSSLESGGSNDLDTNGQNALRIVDEAINQVTDMRAYLGSFQSNTVESNLRSLSVAVENLTASESTVRDLDFAAETAEFTKNQIIFQSGIAVLAQSNLISQSVLTLLG